MELKQIKTIMDERRKFLMNTLGATVAAILVSAIVSNYMTHSIPVFTVLVFAVFTIVLSVFYDIYINSTFRLFLVGEEIYIYYPTYSSRAGNEFIFYKVLDIDRLKVKGSSIVFQGHMMVKTDSVERSEMQKVQDPKKLFDTVFSEPGVYKIQRNFRISRIFEKEEELVSLLEKKKK